MDILPLHSRYGSILNNLCLKPCHQAFIALADKLFSQKKHYVVELNYLFYQWQYYLWIGSF